MISLKRIFIMQSAVVGVCALLLGFLDRKQVPAFLAGAVLITINFILLAVLWQRVLAKKPVATTLGSL